MRRDQNLLREIELTALDSGTDVADGLRKCLALGGQAGSPSLRDWASSELKGYPPGVVLPSYRIIAAPLLLDGSNHVARISGQQVPAAMIPDFAEDVLNKPLELNLAIGEIASLVSNARRNGETVVNLGVPGGPQLVAVMNHENYQREIAYHGYDDGGGPSQNIERIYWAVSVSSLNAVVDGVRTSLTELIAELRAGMSDGEVVPGPELTEQAVSVAVSGTRNRVVVQHVVAGADVGSTSASDGVESEPESLPRRIMWWLTGAAAIAGSVAAVIIL